MEHGIYVIQDKKFNEVLVSLRLIFDLSQEDVTKALVLTQIFSDRLEKYPTKKLMTQLKDELYGAKLNARTYSVGKHQIIDLSVLGINEKFVAEDLHKEYIKVLEEVLYHPLINDITIKEAKKNVYQKLKRSEENPSTYAFYKALQLAGKDQVFGISMLGYEDELTHISVNSINNFHTNLIEAAYKEIYMVGDVEMIHMEGLNPSKEESVIKTKITPGYHYESYESTQTEIIQFYETDINPEHPLYYAYLTFIAYLGQSPSSLLFQNVREKESLCYSIYASQLIYDGVFFISTSIDANNEEKVIDLISKQFDLIKNDDLDLTSTKRYLKNQFDGLSESTRQLLEFEFRNNRLNQDTTQKDLIKAFMDVEVEDVKAVIEHIKEPFTFVYRGVNNEEN